MGSMGMADNEYHEKMMRLGQQRDATPARSPIEDALDRLASLTRTGWDEEIAYHEALATVRAEVEQLTQDRRDSNEHCDLLDAKLEATEAELARTREGLRLVLSAIPDPMHPSMPRQWVDKLVAAKIVALDLLGENDGCDVDKARALLADSQPDGEVSARRRKIKEPPESAELREAFETWAAEHGMVWFDNDVRLAESIAKVLNIDLVWGEGTKRRGGAK